MNIDELENTLNEKFITVYQNILITGEWGIGKTYAIKKCFPNKEKIYISLFGINTIEDFRLNLYMQLIKNKAKIKIIKILKRLNNIQINLQVASIGITNVFENINKVLKKQSRNKELIIIIDDLERKSSNISMEVLLGVIEEFNAIDNIYTIIIANEKEIKEDNELYYSFKEKVIQKTINIDSYSRNAQNTIINNYLKRIPKLKEKKEIYCNYIEKNLQEYKIKNLRSIEKAMKFIEFIINKINNKNLLEDEIKSILIFSLLITIEKINSEIEKKNNINNEYFVINLERKYFMEKSSIGEVLFIISDIYDDIDIESNLNKLIDYFHNVENTEESLFYKSELNLREVIRKFKNDSIVKINNKLNIHTWYRKLIEINEYAKIINYNIFEANEEKEDIKIKEVIEKYIGNSNINIDLKFEIERLYHFRTDKIDKNDQLKAIYDIIMEKIIEKIIDDSLHKISEEFNKTNYDLNLILEVFNNASILHVENNLIQKLKKYDYFFPDLNDNINENLWGIAHTICKKVTECSERTNNDFEIFINQISDKANKIGKYRIGILIQKYNIKLNNN